MSDKSTLTNDITFDEWMIGLNAIARGRGYLHTFGPEQCWFDYYSDGYTPFDALDEDESYACN